MFFYEYINIWYIWLKDILKICFYIANNLIIVLNRSIKIPNNFTATLSMCAKYSNQHYWQSTLVVIQDYLAMHQTQPKSHVPNILLPNMLDSSDPLPRSFFTLKYFGVLQNPNPLPYSLHLRQPSLKALCMH